MKDPPFAGDASDVARATHVNNLCLFLLQYINIL